MNDDDFAETGEIAVIERQDVCNAMSLHRRDEMRVMSVFTLDGVVYHESSPMAKDRPFVAEETKPIDDLTDIHVCLRRRKPESVVGDRSCGDDPILVNDLRDDCRMVTAPSNFCDCREGGGMVGVRGLSAAKQDVGVNQNHSPRPA